MKKILRQNTEGRLPHTTKEGKEATPLAPQIIHKWREIRAKHEGQPRK